MLEIRKLQIDSCEVLFLILITLSSIRAGRFDVFMDRCDVNYSPNYYYNVSCIIEQEKKMNQPTTLLINLQPNVELRNVMQKWTILFKQNDEFKAFLGLNNFTLNICNYLASGGMKAMMMDIMFKDIKQHSNLFNGCPFRGHYYVKEFRMDDADFPSVIKAGNYRFILIYYLKEKDIFLFRLELDIRFKTKSFFIS